MKQSLALIVGGGVLIAVVIGYAVWKNVDTSNAEPVTEERGMAQAWQTLREVGSAHMVTTLDLSLPSKPEEQLRPVADIALKTEGDAVWKEAPQYTGTFSIDAKGRGMQLFVDGDIRVLSERVLFNLHNLPTLLNPTGNLLEKWTAVPTSLLRVTNGEQVTPAFENFFDHWQFTGDDALDGQVALHYERAITPDEARALASVFQQSSSGSPALHVLARLLNNFTVDKADAWVAAESGQLKRLQFHFMDQEVENKQATLQFTFSDHGKSVTVDTPQEEVTVRPEIFKQLFGEGQVESVK